MTLTELYASTPVAEHKNIVVAKDRVYLRTAEGTDEYALLYNGELAIVRSDSDKPFAAVRQDLAAIKAKLGL